MWSPSTKSPTVPFFEVTWQMTGTMRFEASDDLTAKEAVDALQPAQVVGASTIQMTQVISTREVPSG